MATVKKGTKAVKVGWAIHLRWWGKRLLWSKHRKAEGRMIVRELRDGNPIR